MKILKPRHVFTAPCRVTALNILPDKTILVGCEDGSLTALDSAFNTMWNFKLDGPIRDIGTAGGKKPLILTGHGDAGLTAFSGGGLRLWQHTISREPSPWPWWELPSPSPVRVAGGVFNNTPLFAVGCGDIQVRLFDAGGRELWKWRYNEGVPGRIEIYDIDNDGVPEIIVGGEILTDVSSCRVLTHDRCLKAEFKVEGWTSRLTSLAPGAIDGKMLLACGASHGRNLHLYDVTGLDLKVDPALCDRRQHEPIIEDARKRHLWEHRLGGAVNGLHICPEEGSIIAGTSQGFLMFFNMQGKCFYHRLLEEGIASIAPLGRFLLIRHLSGKLRLITTGGSDIANTPASVSSGALIVKDRVIIFSGGKKVFYIIF